MDELVRRCKDGDREAFHDLFKAYGKMIQRISLRMTRKPEYLADIFQEVVARVIHGIGKFREDSQFGTWIYRITVNVNLDFLARVFCSRRANPAPRPIFDAIEGDLDYKKRMLDKLLCRRILGGIGGINQ